MLIGLYLIAALIMLVACRLMYTESSRDRAPDLMDWAHIILVALLWPFSVATFGLLILGTLILNWDKYLFPRITR